MHSEDESDVDGAGNVATIDLTERRAALRARRPTLISRHDRTSPGAVGHARHPVRPVPNARAVAPVPVARPRLVIRPRPAPAAPVAPVADPTDVFWRAPGRHRAQERRSASRLSRWHRWPWSIAVDALIGLLVLGLLTMAVDVLV
ncbi:hypothetical protein GCM10020218_020410 [Dactylosporangium vinaceum]